MIKKRLTLAVLAVLSALMLAAFAFESEQPKPVESKASLLAIVIDDFGNESKGTAEMLALPIKLTAAVMPGMPSSAKDAEAFHAAGKAIILHMPMQSDTGKASWLGNLPITTDLSPETISERVLFGLNELKYAEGMNNHMGSTITKNVTIMTQLLGILKERDLIMLDSKTTPDSVVEKTAKKLGAKCISRDVFLDGTQDVGTIINNLRKAANIAKKTGSAIAIGHVGPEGGVATATAIASLIPELSAEGVQFVTLKELYEALHKQ
ncbi:MAG: divergent polysaccharide deacetylase family protein [Clostridiales bacterium]|jgi:polysaccharide deacetylase 2 family uncharacterized protein YibQ|nr:divergent polysaccharide deacetylase family protein [Clostridiales bacterium]